LVLALVLTRNLMCFLHGNCFVYATGDFALDARRCIVGVVLQLLMPARKRIDYPHVAMLTSQAVNAINSRNLLLCSLLFALLIVGSASCSGNLILGSLFLDFGSGSRLGRVEQSGGFRGPPANSAFDLAQISQSDADNDPVKPKAHFWHF
jgi:hypothetical protein